MKKVLFLGSVASFVGVWTILLACSSSSDDAATSKPDTGADVVSEAVDVNVDRAKKSASPTYHRTQTTICGKTRPPSAPGDSGAGDAGADPCSVDGDCVAGNNGRCIFGEPPGAKGACTYDECYADKDCQTGQICMCRDAQEVHPDIAYGPGQAKPNNTLCVAAPTCKIDNDCGSGGFCSPSLDPNTKTFTYVCHAPDDECTNDDDCLCPTTNDTDLCFFDPAKSHWGCYLKDCR